MGIKMNLVVGKIFTWNKWTVPCSKAIAGSHSFKNFILSNYTYLTNSFILKLKKANVFLNLAISSDTFKCLVLVVLKNTT